MNGEFSATVKGDFSATVSKNEESASCVSSEHQQSKYVRWWSEEEAGDELRIIGRYAGTLRIRFDAVFRPHTTHEEIFERVIPVVE